MELIREKIQGDKTIWTIIIIIMIMSILSVFSSSTLIVSMMGVSSTSFIIKHIIICFAGVFVIYFIHNISSKFFGLISIFFIFIVIIMLLYLLLVSKNSEAGETTARWIRVPIIGTFQPSTLGVLSLLIFTSNFISSKKNTGINFKKFILNLVSVVGLVLLLILPSNFSTAFIGFVMFLTLLFVGGFKMRYILSLIFIGVGFITLFFLLVKAFPDKIPNRIATWENRITEFITEGGNYDYQLEKAKAAISNGGFLGKGAGKSVQKYFLPQSNTDFIFSVIVEEWGFVGALMIIILYLILFWRVIVIIKKSEKKKQKLLTFSCIMPIMFSAFINMGVATNIFPITGQPLPFVSSGGTSIIVYSIAIGIILSVSRELKQKKVIIKLDEEEA